jgi:hypothetical protein
MDAEVEGVCVTEPVVLAVVELLGVFVGVAVLVLGPEEVPVACAVLEAVILPVTGFEGAADGVELVVAAADPDFVCEPVDVLVLVPVAVEAADAVIEGVPDSLEVAELDPVEDQVAV